MARPCAIWIQFINAERLTMLVFAHATVYEIPIAVVVFLAGVCTGPLLAYYLWNRIKAWRE